MSRHLLLMPCSARKVRAPGLIPARDRYDGSPWRTLKANSRKLEHVLEVAVLSAEHGFILAGTPIADYDRKLDAKRAAELELDISAAWLRGKVEACEGRVFLMGSKLYRGCMVEAIGRALVERRVRVGRLSYPGADGHPRDRAPAIGEQLAALKRWLQSIREISQC